ncbi:MAG: hypothetical protein AAF740_08255 [Bacteroidota bacterium]
MYPKIPMLKRIKSSKALTYFIELLIVFVGVYLAFVLNKSQEAQKVENERVRVLTALKYELEKLRLFVPMGANYMEEKLAEWNQAAENDSIADFYSWRYLEPQYNYQIMEYALNNQEPDVVSLELYTELSKAYTIIRHLEQAERRMTAFADQFKNMPKTLDKESNEYKTRRADNFFYFYKFRSAAYDRKNILAELESVSAGVLETINKQFDDQKLKEIEIELVKEAVKRMDEDEIDGFKEKIMSNYKRFTEEELDRIIKETLQTDEE